MSGSVKKDHQRGTWYFRVDAPSVDGKRNQIFRRGYATKKAAESAKKDLERSLDAGVVPSRTTVKEYFDKRWFPALAGDGKLKPTTKAFYRNMAKHLLGTDAVTGLGALQIDELEGWHFDALYDRLRAAGKSERLVRGVHVTGGKAFDDAVRWRLLTFNPVDAATAPSQQRAEPKAWTPEEVKLFLRAAAADRWFALWRLAAMTGLRRGELCALRWTDLDDDQLVVRRNATVVEGRTVETTPKSGRARVLALDPETVVELARWRKLQAAEHEVLEVPASERMWTWPDGSPLLPDYLTRAFSTLVAGAQVRPLRLHGLRHSLATNLLANRVEPWIVADRLGHASTRVTTDIYRASLPAQDRRAATTIAELYDL